MRRLITFLLLLIPILGVGQTYNYIRYNDYTPTSVNGMTWYDNNHFYVKLGGVQYQLDQQTITDGDKGDITVSSSGAAFTIDNDVVTYAKMQNISAASRLLGRGSAAGSGDTQEISLGTNLSLSGTTLNASSITNTGSSNEVVKSDGTNIVGTGLFTSSAGLWTRTGNFNLTTTGDVTFTTANGFGISDNNSTNNTVYNSLTVEHNTTGTPAAGIGTAVRFNVETSASNVETGAAIEAVTTNVSSGSEAFALVLKTMNTGSAAAERVRVVSNGISFPSTSVIGSNGGLNVDANGGTLTLTGNTAVQIGGGTENIIIGTGSGTTTLSNGINNNGSGFKHARVSTGTVVANLSSLVTITWGTAFADANYTPVVEVTTADQLSVLRIESQTAAAIQVRVFNSNTLSSGSGTLNAFAVHD